MNKIGFDVRVLNNNIRSGIGRYAYNLVCNINSGFEPYYMIGNDLPQSNIPLANKILALKGYLEDLDLVHSPYYPLPERRTFKAVLTIHDLIPLRFPEWFANERTYEFFDKYLKVSAQSCDHIIADSQATKQDIMEFYNVSEDKISVIYLGADPIFNESRAVDKTSDEIILSKYKLNDRYLLSVCTIEPRKNLERTLKSYELLRTKISDPIKLVLVGSLGWKYEPLLSSIRISKYAEDILLTGYIPDEELPILYRNAEAFVYPSLYEGFGLPVLEAMASGTAVVTSNLSSLPEVGGDSVQYCDPYEIESITHAIEAVLTSPSLRNALKEKSLTRARQFTWEKTATETRQVYLKCLGERQ